MDQLKLSLGPNFLRRTLASILGKMIRKKLGCNMDILIKDVDITAKDGRVSVHLDLDVETTNEEITKLIKSMDLI